MSYRSCHTLETLLFRLIFWYPIPLPDPKSAAGMHTARSTPRTPRYTHGALASTYAGCSPYIRMFTTVPITKLCAWAEGESGGHVL